MASPSRDQIAKNFATLRPFLGTQTEKMARKVPKDDLPHLLTWLEQYLPDSYVIHGELTSHLRGQFTDVDFFVDTWPLPQAAVAILNPAADQLPSNQDRKMTIVECMHFLNLRALRSLLWDCSLVDWNHCVSLGGVPGSVVPEILEAARESGKSVSFYLYHLMKATPNDLKAIPIPEGLKLQPISTAEIHTMYTTWKLAYEKTETYVREIAERFPSIYLVTDNGQHVGHMVGTVDGTMEMLHMVFLPEACDYIAESKEQSVAMGEPLDGNLMSLYRDAARKNQLWLSVGGFHRKGTENDSRRLLNTHLVIDSQGNIVATYSKSHLFDLDLQGRVRLCESDYTIPGKSIVSPVSTPVGRVALSTCYDVRFPELSIALTHQGTDILTYPSAFTQTTGMAHWEVLLRARAIENQCYVIAAAQTGKHNAKRSSYGHAMIVDPWGTVVAQCREGTDVAVAEIDLSYLAKIRQEMPVQSHRRHDLYPQVFALKCCADGIDDQAEYQFGHVTLESSCVFARSAHSIAFVNIKPVLPGHMLVASLRPAERLSDLTQAEVSDLFTLVQRVSSITQRKFDASSVTVAVQDGPDAGQTVKHVHVHILPRRAGDFEQNDDIYYELQKHDRELSAKSPGLRSKEQRADEAAMMRAAIRESS